MTSCHHDIMTSRHDIMTNNHFWAYTWKQNLFSMSQGSTLSIWHKTYDSMTLWHHDMKTWQHDKQSLLSLHMKTKVVQHVPRINIKHLTYDIWHHDIMTWRHDSMTNNHFWAYTWKQKLFSMSLGSTLSIWHMTYDIMTLWHEDMTAWQTITFEPTHENKSCSACPWDQH